MLTLVESILENPELILRGSSIASRTAPSREMKADGMEYDQRMEELEKLEYPKPLRDFVYDTFNAFADRHPWVGEENIRPKSIAREMFETYKSFAEYILEYDLERSEGLLLRHLNSVYKVLSQTVPDGSKTDEVLEIEWYFKTMVRGVDASLADEWERMRDPAYAPLAGSGRAGLRRQRSANGRALRHHRGYPRLHRRHPRAHLQRAQGVVARRRGRQCGRDGRGRTTPVRAETRPTWTPERVNATLDAYLAEHQAVRFDPEARNARHTHVDATPGVRRLWRVQQMLVDPEMVNDWVAEFDVDLEASRRAQQPVLWLNRLGPLN